MDTMNAVVFYEKGVMKTEKVPKPELKEPTDALVKIGLSTICGSDLHIYRGSLPVEPRATIGHEGVGTIEAVGEEVRGFNVGDRVIISASVQCGKCFYCLKGLYAQCEKGGWYGSGQLYGGYGGLQAQYARVPFADRGLYKIPDSLSFEQALHLGDILSTGYHGALNGQIKTGDIVAVFGSGPVGLCAQLCASLFGPSEVVAVDLLDYRLEVAKTIGSVPINPKREDPIKKIKEMSEGRGADVCIEAVGTKATLEGCLKAVRPCGTVSVLGNFFEPVELNFNDIYNKHTALHSGDVHLRYIPDLMRLVQSKKIDTTFLNTHSMPLGQGEEAYQMFDGKKDNVLKILLKP